jgi:hypothetical protein
VQEKRAREDKTSAREAAAHAQKKKCKCARSYASHGSADFGAGLYLPKVSGPYTRWSSVVDTCIHMYTCTYIHANCS